GFGTGKDVIVGEFVNDPIEVEMEQTQRYNKPRRKASPPVRQCKANRHSIDPADTHHDCELLAFLDPALNADAPSGVIIDCGLLVTACTQAVRYAGDHRSP